MKKLPLYLFSLCALLTVRSADAYVDRTAAQIAIMNKAAGKVQNMTVPVGQPITFEKLSFVVRTCKQTDPFDPEDFFMFIEIFKTAGDQIFGGWMSKSAPGDNPLQNPDYDLWLIKCE